MLIKSLVSAAAIALVATIGSASATEQFTTLEGVTAVPMSTSELDAVTGMAAHFLDGNGGFHAILSAPRKDLVGGVPVIRGYRGLCVAKGISGAGPCP